MSLVAYDSSEDSENEDEEEKTVVAPRISATQAEQLPTPPPRKEEPCKEQEELSTTKPGSLFSLLPAPKRSSTLDIVPEDPVPTTAPKKQPVKIMIPSLKEFEDDDKEEKGKTKRKPSMAGSGLIGLLPAPQNVSARKQAAQLVPHSVTRKPVNAPTKPAPKPSSSEPFSNVTKSSLVTASEPEDGHVSDDEAVTDFFSLSKTEESEVNVSKSEANSENLDAAPFKPDSYSRSYVGVSDQGNESAYYGNGTYSDTNSNVGTDSYYQATYSQDQRYETASAVQMDWSDQSASTQLPTMKDEAFLRLAGKKRGHQQESIEFVDVNGDDLVAGRDEWLLKSLSETNSYQPAPKRSDQPSAMHRRKHQITYLAFQAKAREQELKNQWSMNRMTKKQTQSKYGF